MKTNEAPKNYPMQFKDKIDEYLWKEHQIIGGCCSSIENLKYSVAREVAEKLTDAFIEKAARYLNCRLYDRVEVVNLGSTFESIMLKEEFIEEFKNYMK